MDLRTRLYYKIGSRYASALTAILIRIYSSRTRFGFTARAVDRAKLAVLTSSLESCGERLLVQFPVTIVSPGSVTLGDDCSLVAYVHIWGGGGVSIGDRVMIGAHTSISSLTHDYNHHPMRDTLVRRPVVIEDDVWIGSNCVILPGVRVGQGAVVGAGSVVTRDVAPYTVVAGVPARLLKTRVVTSHS